MNINSFKITRLIKGEHFGFLKNVLDFAKEDKVVSEKCAAQVAALEESLAMESKLFGTSRKSLVTDKITAADKQRDKLYASYKKMVKGFLNFPDERKVAAAIRLNQHIKDFRIDPAGNHNRQTGSMMKFIEELYDKYNEDINLLDLTVLVKSMEEANKLVNQKLEQRAAENLEKVPGSFKDARLASDNAYKELVKYINAFALVDKDNSYTPFINYVNSLIINLSLKDK